MQELVPSRSIFNFEVFLQGYWVMQRSRWTVQRALILAFLMAPVVAGAQSQSWTFTPLYSFKGGTDGSSPYAGVVRDATGNLYGVTMGNTVFRLDPTGSETVLHVFTGGSDGDTPYGGLVRDSSGNLYGTTRYGGANGWGTVFKVDVNGKTQVLYSFSGGADGSAPTGGLLLNTGFLYGATSGWGRDKALGPGNVFKMDLAGNQTVLYNFSGGADGDYPQGTLVRDAAGNTYGTTYYGGSAFGTNGYGVVFKLDATNQPSVLHTFTGGADGG